MRAVNNTLREIILRERPLTVTNNDSLVLSPPLPCSHSSPLFRFTPSPLLPPAFPRSFYSRLAIYSTCLYTIWARAETLRDSANKLYHLRLVVASNRREVFIFESKRVRICKYKLKTRVLHLRLFSRSTAPSSRRIFPNRSSTRKRFLPRPSPLARPSSLDRPVA